MKFCQSVILAYLIVFPTIFVLSKLGWFENLSIVDGALIGYVIGTIGGEIGYKVSDKIGRYGKKGQIESIGNE